MNIKLNLILALFIFFLFSNITPLRKLKSKQDLTGGAADGAAVANQTVASTNQTDSSADAANQTVNKTEEAEEVIEDLADVTESGEAGANFVFLDVNNTLANQTVNNSDIVIMSQDQNVGPNTNISGSFIYIVNNAFFENVTLFNTQIWNSYDALAGEEESESESSADENGKAAGDGGISASGGDSAA
jgi:hypothetical protein